MEKIRNQWTMISILILVFSAGWIAFLPPPAEAVTGGMIPAPREGFLAPDFILQDASGQQVQLSDLRGQPVLINLWASWCAPCRQEMPAMQAAYEAYASEGFTILAVNTTYQDDRSAALSFAANLGLTFPILFDEDGSVSRAYQTRLMPTSLFIDREGVVRRVVLGGPMSEALLRAEVERLLREGQ
jgi:cytochrome c biogenesis protein CcmG, thiol:disulfide interchange protein DsbE